jgi:alginate O-acetyltransferase complex protein AlgI
VGFGIQIYGDFSGYSDIARGSARLLGVELMRNFEQPYLSTSITEFWRRWHISLSTWLRDYLYIPLGGNRGTAGRTSRNLMVTMLLGGLWHGAAWTFVVWGGLHGLYLLVHRRVGRGAVERSGLPRWREVPAVAVTWLVVHVAWVFFRADGFGQAVDVLSGIVTWRAGAVDRTALVMVPVALAATLFIDVAQRVDGRHSAIAHWRPVARGVAYGVGAAAFLVFAGQAPVPFIYFQF